MNKIFEKINKWVVVGVAALIFVLRAISAIINLTKFNNVSGFWYGITFMVVIALAAWFAYKEDKGKLKLILLLISAYYCLCYLANGFNYFDLVKDYAVPEVLPYFRTESDYVCAQLHYVFGGIAYLTGFVGIVAFIAPNFTSKFTNIFKQVCTYALLVSMFFTILSIVFYLLVGFISSRAASIMVDVSAMLTYFLFIVFAHKE